MKIYPFVILILYIALQAVKHTLEYMNLRYARSRTAVLPRDFEGIIDRPVLDRMHGYMAEKVRFGIVASACGSCAAIAFFFGGLLDLYNSWIAGFGLSFILSGWLFFLLLYLAGELLSVPFTLYFVFRVEKRYGFNTTTFSLWLADFGKSMAISIVLLSFTSFAGFWLIDRSPEAWWFWVWCFFFAFAVFVTYISPYVIEPLFNKFTPLQEGDLRDRVLRLASRAGINVSKVLRMDASRRSTHTNAYFTGIGRTKRIVLFDTLLGGMTPDEIVSVLAHEIGHWKRRHLLKGLALTQLASLVFFFCAYWIMRGPILSDLFGIARDTFFVKATIVAFFLSMVSFLFKPVMNGFSRMLEREADRTACDLTGDGETMVAVLVKLSKDNLSNLFPHPLYALFNYSHPPVLERIGYIRAYCARKGGE